MNESKSAAPIPASPPDNPYLNARRAWNEHVGDVIAARRMWQAVALLCLAIALAAVGGVVYLGSQSRFVPYVVEVDELGRALAVAPAEQAAPADPRVIHAALAAFVADARLVTPDMAVQRNAVFRVYALLSPNDPATTKMNEWLNGSEEANPFKRAEKEMVSTEILSVLPQSPETWQVEWTETASDRQGAPQRKARLRALLTVYLVPPTPQTTEDQIRRNPLGIYVRDFSWSEIK